MRVLLISLFVTPMLFPGGCMPDTESVSEHPCLLAENCVYDDEERSSRCADGFTWADPDDLENFNCVLEESCAPTSCEASGYNCGEVPDGCGEVLNCGECAAGENCGALGPNICGAGMCVPRTCASQGANCGSLSDGCGEIVDCGSCSAGLSCGAGGVSNVCAAVPTDPPAGLDDDHLLQSRMTISGMSPERSYCQVSANNDVVCWGGNYWQESSLQTETGNWVGTSNYCNLDALGNVRCVLTSSTGSSVQDLSLPPMKQISSRHYRYLTGVTTSGGLVAWDTSRDTELEKTDPIPSGIDFVSTTLNRFAACGLRASGNVVCWKHNGERDDPYNLLSPPVGVTFKQIALGSFSGCGLGMDGRIRCWGVTSGESFTDYGQVTDAPSDDGYVAIDVYDETACAIRNNGQVKCWGHFYDGVETAFTIDNATQSTVAVGDQDVCARTQAGNVTCQRSVIPRLMETTHQDVSVSLESICSITSAGDPICTGKLSESEGYLSSWSSIRANAPYTKIATWSPYSNIANNPNLLCTLGQNGRLRCWGGGGDSSRTVALFNDVNSLSGEVFTRIAVGVNFGCGLNAAGEVRCFGENSNYADGPSGSGYTSLDVGEIYSAAIDGSGQMQCWGGSGTCAPESMRFTRVSVDKSGQYSYPVTWGIDTEGALHQWGYSNASLTPQGAFREVDAGGNVACAIKTSNTLSCWGMAEEPPAGSNFQKVVTDTDQACALTTDGKLACWGNIHVPIVH